MGTIVDDILANRAGKHGEFNENGTATWQIMRILMAQRSWPNLTDPQRHALYMQSHKMARIVAGDVNEPDHWDDIAGYATLVAARIRNPVALYDIKDDAIGAMAVSWNVTREEAAARFHELSVAARRKRDELDALGEQERFERELAQAAEAGVSEDPAPAFLFRQPEAKT